MAAAEDPEPAKPAVARATKEFWSMRRPSLVYTLLGSKIKYQEYMWHSIEQARAMNPVAPIYLVLHRSGYEDAKAVIDGHVSDRHLHLDFYDDLATGNAVVEDFQRSFVDMNKMVPPDGNEDFTRLTTERLVAVYALLTRRGLHNVFHIENDNLMYVGLDSVLPTMRKCNVGLGIPIVHVNQAVISFAFFYDAAALEVLIKYIIDLNKLGADKAREKVGGYYVHDMSATYRFMQEAQALPGRRKVVSLPTWIRDPAEPADCVWEADKALWDGASMGQFFGGTHDKPGRGWFDKDRPFKELPELRLEWQKCDFVPGELHCPYLKGHRVMNLHLHCKLLEPFMSKNRIADLPT